ncbi:nicotinate-nicotinamide nucleotide adenylyltransferase [Psychrobacter sp. FDAARGOS_221]|uniref:nicotinate-nicotinamide nucleotide adenylyltransferase n=1 Tax=Psychrobacter sp. FDAARGOS_221 TaxID=1975705 RepID=UPI000BB52BFE|nr:nicotinate-nucleotide adenylyltransferase [Psychrobacter sp. FDAARGOS_221]PNK60408.1 nicotinate-nicotinamide nucleotide adenylyltransferase [Psychrobacter sp. FDAARGOS_221]
MTNPDATITANPQQLPIQIYLGGSFDPVHHSHLDMLQHVAHSVANHKYSQVPAASHQSASPAQVDAYFMPTSRSPLKQNSSSPQHRLAMLQLAITDCQQHQHTFCEQAGDDSSLQPRFLISEAEIWQPPPTYSIDTLTQLRADNPSASLIFVIGADNIASLPQWRDGDKLTQLCHLWIIPRDQLQHKQQVIDLLPKSLTEQVTDSISDLKTHRQGRIYIDSVSVAPISSTAIRQAIFDGQHNIAKTALPDSVYSYIMKNNLYTPQ